MSGNSESNIGFNVSGNEIQGLSETRNSESFSLSFKNLETYPTAGDFYLHDISAELSSSQIHVIMGQTGCGKTTLMNVLAGHTELRQGSVFVNKEIFSQRHRRQRIGYVMQEDVYFPTLTLKETIVYSALLRLSDHYSRAQKIRKVHDIMRTLNLSESQDTYVGVLSGGEKKRLSIACELIMNPQVLLIDEPTSGLDSFTASQLMKTLKDYAMSENKTVVATIHQPSSSMFQSFNTLLLMNAGRLIYFGSASAVISHYESVGIDFQPNYNPAEFILEKLNDESCRQKLMTRAVPTPPVQKETCLDLEGDSNHNNNNHCNSESTNTFTFNETGILEEEWNTSFLSQVSVLCKRNFRLGVSRIFSKVNVIQTLMLGIMVGAIWFQTPPEEANISDLEGWMFFSNNYWMLFVLFQALWAFPMEKAVIEKERKAGYYRLSSYFASKLIVEYPLEIVLPCVFLTISYPMIGGSFQAFFGILAAQLLASMACQSAGVFFGYCFGINTATTVAAIFTVGAQLLGGYLANNFPSALKILSFVYNGLKNMQLIQYFSIPIKCAEPSIYPSCTSGVEYVNPEDLLLKDTKGGFAYPYWSHSVFLLSCIILFRVIGYMVLRRSL